MAGFTYTDRYVCTGIIIIKKSRQVIAKRFLVFEITTTFSLVFLGIRMVLHFRKPAVHRLSCN